MRGKRRKSISWIFMWYRTASQETDFTFLNKAHNVRHTHLPPIFTYRRLLGHKIFHLFMKYFSVMYSFGSSDSEMKTKCRKKCIARLLPRDAYRIRCYSVNLPYNYNFITSTYIRARCSFHNVWHRRYDPLTRNTCAISWSRRGDDDNDETDDDDEDDEDDDCCISISWISCFSHRDLIAYFIKRAPSR